MRPNFNIKEEEGEEEEEEEVAISSQNAHITTKKWDWESFEYQCRKSWPDKKKKKERKEEVAFSIRNDKTIVSVKLIVLV